MNRRIFVGLVAVQACWGREVVAQTGQATDGGTVKWTAAVIGHTGRGGYGHQLDLALSHRRDIKLVAVADADERGRAAAVVRLGEVTGFPDYEEMLTQLKPGLVVVAPRHSDQHHDMVLAALRSGAHVFCEKPLTVTLAEADALLIEARDRGLKIAVAHQMRLQPDVLELKKRWDAGEFGELIELRAWGKQDARVGGEDMMVLGTHLFDLMRFFAGDVEWVTSRIRQKGEMMQKRDRRVPRDNVGPVAGDEIFAHLSFKNGAMGSFTSHAGLSESTGRWGIELRGRNGAARLCTDIPTEVFVEESTGWTPAGRTDVWKKPAWAASLPEEPFRDANRRVVDDWIAAIEADREPQCSGMNAMHSLEVVCAIYHASLRGGRVMLPLADRTHPLAD